MKFVKNFGEYNNTLNEAKARVNKSDVKDAVLKFLTKEKDILTQHAVSKGVDQKVEATYGALMDLEHEGKVAHVSANDFSETTKRAYPHYYATDALTKVEAADLAKEKESKSKEENKEKLDKKKEVTVKAKAEREEKEKETAKKAKSYKERKAKGEVKPRAKKKTEKK